MKTSPIKKTILVITGTRAEYGLLRPVMREIQKSKTLSLKLLVTGMHTLSEHGRTIDDIRRDRMPIAHVVRIAKRDSMPDALGKEIVGIGKYCEQHRPDMILVLGDRDESFAGAIVGGHLGIPVAHIHGGDKTGFIVDEYIRHATSKFSHLHFAATKASARRVRLLGEEAWRVCTVGAPGLDELRGFKTEPVAVIAKKYGLSSTKPWHVILQHPTPHDPVPLDRQVTPLLKEIARLKGEKIILYPNADTGSKVFIQKIKKYQGRSDVHIFRHIPRADLIAVLKHAATLIGNSSMGIIDASYLRIPTVNVGNRQTGRERGQNVINCGYDASSIRSAIRRASTSAFKRKVLQSKSPYGNGTAAPKIVRVIEKYIDRKHLFHKKLTYV